VRRSGSILVLNCGSSSVKFALYQEAASSARSSPEPHTGDSLSPVLSGQVSGLSGEARLEWRADSGRSEQHGLGRIASHTQALDFIFELIDAESTDWHQLDAVGHRIVHGGGRFDRPVLIDAGVMSALEEHVPLAPLHQPHNLAGVRAVAARAPQLPQIACFDTAFHAAQSPLHTTFALPASMRKRGVRRYGFHGLSYQSIAEKLPALVGAQADGRVIVAHLGSGASVCGMIGRQSVRTSMGMTALDGLVMGTRPGSVDIGVALHALTALGMNVADLSHALYDHSGLLGLSEISADVRVLSASDDPRAALALEVFCERAAQEIAATAVSIGGLDLLVFTAGIGENSASIRERIVSRLAWLGLRLDPFANARHDAVISAADSSASVRVVPTDEQAVIVNACRAWLRTRS
jgi:acetate kinase